LPLCQNLLTNLKKPSPRSALFYVFFLAFSNHLVQLVVAEVLIRRRLSCVGYTISDHLNGIQQVLTSF
jgi:hypothetical protein